MSVQLIKNKPIFARGQVATEDGVLRSEAAAPVVVAPLDRPTKPLPGA
jgi:hypothetical protein